MAPLKTSRERIAVVACLLLIVLVVAVFHHRRPTRPVWVNTASGIYHEPGTRWYGHTHYGQYMSESEAKKHGYRHARNER